LDSILQMRAPDVQAALTVLGGGTFAAPLDLHGMDLRRADLTGVNLGEARLGGADLKGAVFVGADLRGPPGASAECELPGPYATEP
jgi:uncharacterized protein YjbI with pentapeptide repeats